MHRRVIAPAATSGGGSGSRLIGALLTLLLMLGLSHANPAASTYRITVVTSRDIAPYRAAKDGFLEVLERSGVRYRIEELRTDGAETTDRKFIQTLRNTRPDLILTIGSAATRAVGDEVHDIPIIFSLVLEAGDPGQVDPFGPNVTGASMYIPLRVQFEKLRDAMPDARRFGVMYNPAETGEVVDQAEEVAEEVGLELVRVPVHSPAEVLSELENLDRRVDLLWSVADSTVFTPQSVHHILLSTLRKKIPFIGLSPSYVRAGALLALSCDYLDVGRQSGELALEVLHGSKPGQVPVTVPRRISFYLNLNTAKQLEIELSEQIKETAEVVSGS
ncbi:MAG: ABC transporter substrate-binding protein [Acidobacteriota bacterium]